MSQDSLHSQLEAFIGLPSRTRRVAPDPVSMAQIRRWTEAFGDENPIYLDDAAARAAGRLGIVAPPAMLPVFTGRGLRETRAGESAPSGWAKILADQGFVTPGSGMAQFYEADIRPGDRLSETTELESISTRKETKLGPGYFITIRMDFTNQEEQRVGFQRLSVFAFQPGTADRRPDPAQTPGTGQHRQPECADDEALPPLSIAMDRLGIIACSTACGDFNASHYDPDMARSHGFEDIFTDIFSGPGFAQRYVSDWAGPAARIASINVRLGASLYAGDVLHLSGTVKERSAEETTVAFRGVCRTGVHLEGTARLLTQGA